MTARHVSKGHLFFLLQVFCHFSPCISFYLLIVVNTFIQVYS